MKTPLFILGAGAVVLSLTGFTSCGSGHSHDSHDHADGHEHRDSVQLYTGVLPAADVDGIRYDLRLEYDDDHNFTDGDYDLRETYLTGDSTVNDKTFLSEGDFTVNKKDGLTYLRLVQDLKDSQPGSKAETMYFLVENDSTITLVNDQLQKSDSPGLNYSLRLSR